MGIKSSEKIKKNYLLSKKNQENIKIKHHSLDDLKIHKENTVLKEIKDSFNLYLDSKLSKLGLNNNQKNNIKLTLLSDFFSKFNGEGKINISKSIDTLIKKIPNFLKANKDKEKIIDSQMKKLFDGLGLINITETIDSQIEKVKNEKNKTKFDELESSFSSLGLDKKSFGDIQLQINTAHKKLNKIEESVDTVKNIADELGLGESLKNIFEWLKSIPILGPILMGIFKQLDKNGNGEKSKKSVENLQKILENKKKSPLDKIENNNNFKNKEKLNPQRLDKFYKYLDSKNVKYSKDTFWEELFSGKSENTEIQELHKLLYSTQNEKLKGTQFKYISLEKFIETLNNLGNLKNKQEKENIIIHNTQVKIQIEKAKEEGKTEKIKRLEKQIKYSFEDLLKQNKVEIEGKIKDIKIENNKIINIGGDRYKIEIKSFIGEYFESISLYQGKITIKANGQIKSYSSSEVKPIFEQLINNGSYNQKIPGKPANLVITKI